MLKTLIPLFLILSTQLLWAQAASNFDGIDDKATVYHHSDFNLSTHDFTIEAVVRDVALDQPMLTIISKRNLSSNGFALILNTEDGFKLIAEIGKDKYEIDASIFEDRRCHSVGLRRSENEITLFIDDNAYNLGKNTRDINTDENLIIGDDGSNTHNPFNGYIEEVRFWKVARTDRQVFDWNHKCIPSSTRGLIALWNIEETTGQFFHDVASIKHHAYLGSGFSSDNQDPLWTSNECLETCCEVQAEFSISTNSPKAYQYVNFTNTSSNSSSYQWIVNDIVEANSTDFKFSFTVGTHIVSLLAENDGCKAMQSWVFEVTDFLDNCGTPTNIHSCEPDFLTGTNNTMRILDGFGNCYAPEEVALPSPNITKSSLPGYPNGQVCQCGIFTLYYQDVITNTDAGFDDPNTPQGTGFTTLGEERRAVLCRAFEDISLLIGANPIASNLGAEDLRISVDASDGTGVLALPANAVAAGTSYFFEWTAPITHKFALGEISKTIIGGRDSYQDWTLYNPTLSNSPHGIVSFNFPNVSFNSNLASITGNHLYITALHEITHALGFRSLIGSSTGPSLSISDNAPNIYAYWDQFLESNQIPIINRTITANNLTLNFTNNTVNSCGNPSLNNGLAFDGISNTGNHPVYYNGAYQTGSSFSHYNCSAGVSGYVMNFSGIASSHLNPLEVETLCKLGYTISGNFGQDLTSINQSNTLMSYNTCTPSQCVPVSFVDIENPNNTGNPFTVDRSGSNNQAIINFSDLLLNDFVPAGTTVEDLQILQGGGTLSVTSSNGNTSFTYSPSLGFGLEWAILSYVPRCPNGELGEMTYVYIWVPAAAYPNCNLPNSSCNIVCNGDFEAFEYNYGSRHSQLENFYANYAHRTLNSIGTVDLMDFSQMSPQAYGFLRNVLNGQSAASNCNSNITINDIPKPINFPNDTKYIGLGTFVSSNNIGQGETFNLKLNTALIQPAPSSPDNYRLGFWIYTPCSSFDLRFIFSDGESCPITGSASTSRHSDLRADNVPTYAPIWNAFGPSHPSCNVGPNDWGNQNQHFNLQVPFPTTAPTNQWVYVTQDFQVDKANLDNLIIHLDPGSANGTSSRAAYVILDNISIERIDQPKVNISSTIIGNTCPGSTPTIQYTIEGDASIPLGAPLTNVQLDITLPNSIPSALGYAQGGDFVNGQYTIPVLNQGDLVVLSLPLNVAGNAIINSSHQVLINATATGACVSSTSNQNTTVNITSTSLIGITTTIINSSNTNIQYQIDVTNSGPDAVSDIHLEVPTVNGLNFNFNPALFTLASGATQTFNINATIGICNTQTLTLCAEINSANSACNLPIVECISSIFTGTNLVDFPIEAENTTHTDPTIFTATAINNNNEIYSVGIFSNDIDFIEGTNTNTLVKNHTCTSLFSPFLVKYSSCGFEWAVEIPICSPLDLRTTPDIEVSQNGDIYVAFSFEGSFTVNNSTYTSQGGVDIAIIKYNATGTPIWVKTEGGIGQDWVTDIEIYTNGTNEEIFIVGTLFGSTPNIISFSNTTNVGYNNFGNFCASCNIPGGITYLASYTDNGTSTSMNWVNSINNTATFSGKLSVDPIGNLYIIGVTNSSFTFNGITHGTTTTTLNEGPPSGSNHDIDVFVAKYSNSGAETWAELYGGNGMNYGFFEGLDFEFDIECESTTHLGILLPSINSSTGSQTYMQELGTHILRIDASNGSLIWTNPIATPTTSQNSILGNLTYASNLTIHGTDYLVNGSFLLQNPNSSPIPATGFSSIDFHGTTVNYTSMSSYPAYDNYQGTFTASFNNTGGLQWVNSNTTIIPLPPANDRFATLVNLGIETDNVGNIHTPFFLRGTTTLNTNNLTGGISGNQDVVDGFISKIDGVTGNYLRPNTTNATTNAQNDLTVTSNNNQTLEMSEIISTSNIATKLYPNPTTGTITLEILSDLDNNKVEQITIYDVTGRKVQTISTEKEQNIFDIDLNSQQSGVYFVELMVNQELITKRVILMK